MNVLCLQDKRKEKLQKQQIQQQQKQKVPLVTNTKRSKSEGDGKPSTGFVVLDIQQPNSTPNHLQVPLMGIPLKTLQDVPETLL